MIIGILRLAMTTRASATQDHQEREENPTMLFHPGQRPLAEEPTAGVIK